MRKLYVDTNVFVSYLQAEYGKKVTVDQQYEAEMLFDRALKCEFSFCISKSVIYEMVKVMKLSEDSINSFLNRFIKVGKLEVLKPCPEIFKATNEIIFKFGFQSQDAINAAFALHR